jgi:hypothetical protein
MATSKSLKAHPDSQKKSADPPKTILKEGAKPEQAESTKADTKAADDLLHIPGASLTATGLVVDKGLTQDDALDIAKRLASIKGVLPFAWADLALAAESFPEEWQQEFKKLVDEAGIPSKTLSNYKTVARKFPPSRRREGLYFGHYDAVQGLETKEADRLLKLAETTDASVHKLRDLVAKLNKEAEEAARKEAAKKAAEEAAKKNNEPTKPDDTSTGTGCGSGAGTKDDQGTGFGNYHGIVLTNEEVLKKVDEWVKGVDAVKISWDPDDDTAQSVPALSALGVDDQAFYEAIAQLMSELHVANGADSKVFAITLIRVMRDRLENCDDLSRYNDIPEIYKKIEELLLDLKLTDPEDEEPSGAA